MGRIGLGIGLGITLALVGIGGSSVPPAQAAAATPKVTVTDSGFTAQASGTSHWKVSAVGAVKNPTGKLALGVQWTLALKDAQGKVRETYPGELTALLPGQQANIARTSDSFVDFQPASIKFTIRKVRKLVALSKASSSERPPSIGVDPAKLFTFANLRVRHVAFANNAIDTVIGTVTNNGNALLSKAPFVIDVTCALYAKGKMIASAYDQIPALPPATPVAFLGIVLPGLGADDIRCSSDHATGRAVTSESTAAGIEVGTPMTGRSEGATYVVTAAPVTNRTDKVAVNVYPQFDMADASGRIIGHSLSAESLPYLLPGQQSTVGGATIADWLDGSPATVTLRTAVGEWLTAAEFTTRFGYDPTGPPPITVTNTRVDPASRYFADLLGTLTNTTSKRFSVYVQCAVLRNNVPFATYWTPGVAVGPGATVDFKATGGDLAPADAAGAEVHCDAFPRAA